MNERTNGTNEQMEWMDGINGWNEPMERTNEWSTKMFKNKRHKKSKRWDRDKVCSFIHLPCRSYFLMFWQMQNQIAAEHSEIYLSSMIWFAAPLCLEMNLDTKRWFQKCQPIHSEDRNGLTPTELVLHVQGQFIPECVTHGLKVVLCVLLHFFNLESSIPRLSYDGAVLVVGLTVMSACVFILNENSMTTKIATIRWTALVANNDATVSLILNHSPFWSEIMTLGIEKGLNFIFSTDVH